MIRLDEYVNKHDCQFLAVTEHWKSAEELSVHRITNFELISSHCRNVGAHGGSAVYIRNNFAGASTEIIEFVRMSVPYSFECSAVNVNIVNKHIVVVAIY